MIKEKLIPIFQKIYGKEQEIIDKQLSRYENLSKRFKEKFSREGIHYFSTPGRTEIGGNHTDHNFGRVLAGSVDLDSVAIVAPNENSVVSLYSVGYDGIFKVDLSDLSVKSEEKETTNSLIRGIAARFNELGYNIGGFDAYITSSVLSGSGLSSSASIEVLLGTIFSALYNDNKISPEELAIIGQYAENNYFGKPCGLMDQVACAMGGIVTIDFKNPSDPVIEKVDFDFEAQNHKLLVVDTGGSHADLTEDYASVPAEMKSVAEALGAEVCRELSMEKFLPSISKLRSSVGDRAVLRAFHFLIENERVVDQVNALKNNDFDTFLQLIKDSGNSSFKWLQNIYSPKNPGEQGVSLALALTEKYITDVKKGACRVHGGGFAGTIQVFLPNDLISDYIELMEGVYGKGSVTTLQIRPLGTLHLNSYKGN
jgi:galactokinase